MTLFSLIVIYKTTKIKNNFFAIFKIKMKLKHSKLYPNSNIVVYLLLFNITLTLSSCLSDSMSQIIGRNKQIKTLLKRSKRDHFESSDSNLFVCNRMQLDYFLKGSLFELEI
jgi:hypothetical protein